MIPTWIAAALCGALAFACILTTALALWHKDRAKRMMLIIKEQAQTLEDVERQLKMKKVEYEATKESNQYTEKNLTDIAIGGVDAALRILQDD